MTMAWFRMYSDILTDDKIIEISEDLEVMPVIVSGFWNAILCMANESPIRGKLMMTKKKSLSVRAITRKAGIDKDTAEKLLSKYIDFEMLEIAQDIYSVSKWDKRQFASDSSTERVNKHRKKKQQKKEAEKSKPDVTLQGNETETLHETVCNVSVTPPDTDTDTDTDTDDMNAPSGSNRPSLVPNAPVEVKIQQILYIACRIDPKSTSVKHRNSLHDHSIAFTKRGFTLQQIQEACNAWYTDNDWGKQNKPPWPSQIGDWVTRHIESQAVITKKPKQRVLTSEEAAEKYSIFKF